MADRPARIYVLAGANGAGKSSVAGAMFLQRGVPYFNPDTATKLVLRANPGIPLSEANAVAWQEGKRLLEKAIAERLDFAFETTLGGKTITALLDHALLSGIEVKIWFVGLVGPELHIARVQARVQQGGHDIPESQIRERYTNSRLNLIRLLPRLTELLLYDNSADADPARGRRPQPQLILHAEKGKVRKVCALDAVPEWAKPIVAAAMKADGTISPGGISVEL